MVEGLELSAGELSDGNTYRRLRCGSHAAYLGRLGGTQGLCKASICRQLRTYRNSEELRLQGFLKIGVIGVIVLWGLYWGPPIYGSFPLGVQCSGLRARQAPGDVPNP